MVAPLVPYVRSPVGVPIPVAAASPSAGVLSADPAVLCGFTFFPFGGGWASPSNALLMFYDAAAPPADPVDPLSPPPDAVFQYDPSIDPRLVVGAEYFGVKGQKFKTAISYVFVDITGGTPANAYTGGSLLVGLVA